MYNISDIQYSTNYAECLNLHNMGRFGLRSKVRASRESRGKIVGKSRLHIALSKFVRILTNLLSSFSTAFLQLFHSFSTAFLQLFHSFSAAFPQLVCSWFHCEISFLIFVYMHLLMFHAFTKSCPAFIFKLIYNILYIT